MNSANPTVVVSGYSKAEEPGIHFFRFDARSGELTKAGESAGIQNPSFTAVHPYLECLYTVGEATGGEVWALRRTQEGVAVVNHQSSGGDGPCHLAITRGGEWIFVANYVSGSIALLPVLPDGTLAEAVSTARHTGSGPNSERQDAAHAHSTILSPDERHVIAVDLGTDGLYTYQVDEGVLVLRYETRTRPGAGPRHAVFHPKRDLLYVANELDNTVALYDFDVHDGRLKERQVLSTVPPNAPPTTTADIHITRDGRRLYVSNRGYDSIAAYSVDTDGTLSLLGIGPSGGRTPRNFSLSPDERYLLVANQDSHDVCVFTLENNGEIGTTALSRVEVPSPTCVVFETDTMRP